jgi:hypothetical protein
VFFPRGLPDGGRGEREGLIAANLKGGLSSIGGPASRSDRLAREEGIARLVLWSLTGAVGLRYHYFLMEASISKFRGWRACAPRKKNFDGSARIIPLNAGCARRNSIT